jgi:hypothetical protein
MTAGSAARPRQGPGFEAFDRDEQSLGMFKTQREAADAISDSGNMK